MRAQHEPERVDLSKYSLFEVVGVTETSHARYQAACRQELTRIRELGANIMNRPFRECVGKLGDTLLELTANCDRDPEDIREELGLPTVLSRIRSGLAEYLELSASGNSHALVLGRMQEIETSVALALPWLTDLLERMRANDGEDVAVRARVLSQVFRPRVAELERLLKAKEV